MNVAVTDSILLQISKRASVSSVLSDMRMYTQANGSCLFLDVELFHCNADACVHMCYDISLAFNLKAFMLMCVSVPSVMPFRDGTTAAAISLLFLLLKITPCCLAKACNFTESFHHIVLHGESMFLFNV